MDELCGRLQNGTGCHRSRDGIGAQHLLRGPLRIGGVHRHHVVHHIGVEVFRHKAVAQIADAVGAGQAAAQRLRFVRLHGGDAHIVRPCLDGLAHAGHGAAAAHADHDSVHSAFALPRDALHNGRAGNAAVVLRVIIVGKPVHVVPAVCGGGLCRQTACTVHTAAGRAVADLRTQPQQGLLPQGGGILRHHQNHRMTGGQARQRERNGKRAGGRFNDGLTGDQLLFFNGKGQHPFGKAVPGRAGGACKVQIGIQPSLQPAGGSIAAQLHDGAGAERLVKIGVDRHEDPPFMGYNNIILTQKDCARQDAF